MERVYLDWNATTPLRPAARTAMNAAMDLCGNPSSVHAEGRRVRGLLDSARRAVCEATGASPGDLIFTSGGTEANALALSAASLGRSGGILTSAIEHHSVLANAEGSGRIAVTADGIVDLADLRAKAKQLQPALISVMLANNETGAIQPIAQVADIAREHSALLHVDAIQAFGKIAFQMNDLGADLLSVSAHKIGGPQGVGALALGARVQGLKAMLRGGGQESGRRAGTENVVGIAGFGAAVTEAFAERDRDMRRINELRDRLEAGLTRSRRASIVSASVPRLPTTTTVTAAGLRAETALIRLDLAGFAVSSGSACSSGKVAPSHVLAAMGYPAALSQSAIRISLGWTTTQDHIDRFLEAWRSVEGALLKADETVLERF